MRLLKSQIEAKAGTGFATLLPEEPEDMWHAYNLIQQNDLLRAKAIRKVSKTTETSKSTQRIAMDLTIAVTSTDFDPGSGQLHVSGRVTVENQHVKLSQHHTLDLELNRKFTLEKADGWDSVAIEQLKDACDNSKKAELWAVVMGEGIANICMVTEHQTILRQKVDVPVPRKRKGAPSDNAKGMEKFFATTLSTLLRQLDLTPNPSADPSNDAPKQQTSQPVSKTTPLIIASPGFIAPNFFAYIKAEAQRTTNKPLLALLPSIIVAHSHSPHIHSLTDTLTSPAITAKLGNTKYARETSLMDELTTHLRKEDDRGWYGYREVERAVDAGAVGRGGGILLINNSLFRATNIAERRKWVSLVDRVREVEGGEVRILSESHESGKRLEYLGGVAAILTFPVEGLDEDGDEDGAVVDDGERDEDRDMIV